ncbi:unnamed protein product [Rotaria sp. Silwood1]|nr:unnamed protein product [Rotaria sp. Silwood1]
MENFLKQKFGFHNIEGQYIVSGVRAFKLSKPISQLEPNKKIYFPYDQYHNPFIMTVDEIRRWQNSYVVYADGNARNMNKKFLSHALQRRSENGSEAFFFTLPIFAKDRNGRQLSDTYDDFVNEFTKANYSGPILVLIADQDMHELTIAIALGGFRVSQLSPADSHGVFGEYWQNHGPAVEEKLALTTLGLLVQHHLINPYVLDPNRYKLI